MLVGGTAEAAFKLCNQSAGDVSVAVGFLDGANGWTAQGWWTIAAGGCETPVKGKLAGEAMYLLVDGGGARPAAGQSGGWFCTDDDGFSTRNADYADDQHQLMCQAAGLKLEQFREIPIRGADATFTLR
jgi:uncharacterized membrane protein